MLFFAFWWVLISPVLLEEAGDGAALPVLCTQWCVAVSRLGCASGACRVLCETCCRLLVPPCLACDTQSYGIKLPFAFFLPSLVISCWDHARSILKQPKVFFVSTWSWSLASDASGLTRALWEAGPWGSWLFPLAGGGSVFTSFGSLGRLP